MSHHVIAAIRSPRIGGPLRVLNEKTFPRRYDADQWIGAHRAEWCSCVEAPDTHVLIIVLDSQMKPRCIIEQPADWSAPSEKFTGSHLVEALKAFRIEDRTYPETREFVPSSTHDMTDRDEPKGVTT